MPAAWTWISLSGVDEKNDPLEIEGRSSKRKENKMVWLNLVQMTKDFTVVNNKVLFTGQGLLIALYNFQKNIFYLSIMVNMVVYLSGIDRQTVLTRNQKENY